jgi:hypothetical protein
MTGTILAQANPARKPYTTHDYLYDELQPFIERRVRETLRDERIDELALRGLMWEAVGYAQSALEQLHRGW